MSRDSEVGCVDLTVDDDVVLCTRSERMKQRAERSMHGSSDVVSGALSARVKRRRTVLSTDDSSSDGGVEIVAEYMEDSVVATPSKHLKHSHQSDVMRSPKQADYTLDESSDCVLSGVHVSCYLY